MNKELAEAFDAASTACAFAYESYRQADRAHVATRKTLAAVRKLLIASVPDGAGQVVAATLPWRALVWWDREDARPPAWEARPSSSVTEAIPELVELRRILGADVSIDFNGVALIVAASTTEGDLFVTWDAAMSKREPR